MDKIRSQLKTMNRQSAFFMEQKTAMKNNLISLLDQIYPDANDFFDSPARPDGSQKWVDFVHTYWHAGLRPWKIPGSLYGTLPKLMQTQGLQLPRPES